MTKHFGLRSLLAVSILIFAISAPVYGQDGESVTYDVVVYGATSAGVIAAVQVARSGRSVVLIEPGQHPGGMSSSGLGRTDHGNVRAIGGLSKEFYQRLYVFYHGGGLNNPGQWTFEPHAAEEIFNELLEEDGIEVIYGERLDLRNGVVMDGNKIDRIVMESGREFSGRIFIDATYEGDLMALAGVSYTVGRESASEYGETYNGVQTGNARHHNFNLYVDPYLWPGDPSSGLLPNVTGEEPGVEGVGDDRVQAYNYRLCLTNNPENRLMWHLPAYYDQRNYELLIRYFEAGLNSIPYHMASGMPNGKTDVNNSGGFSTDYIGMNYDYPEGDYETREEIAYDHEMYIRGLMYTLSYNPRIPLEIRQRVREWGLARDEFTDNRNWPYMMYIREARRMVSDYVMTEHNCTGWAVAPDSIGMGSYQMDSHNVQRYVDESGYVRNEGDIQVGGFDPYPISYRSIIPREGECENLLVPVCVSASHIAFGSIRMEPVFMILGQSAAVAAIMALDEGCSVQEVEYGELRMELIRWGQVVERSISIENMDGVVIDEDEASLIGEWEGSVSEWPYVGEGYIHDNNAGDGCTASYIASLPTSGQYEVRVYYTDHQNRATNTSVSVDHAFGLEEIVLSQRVAPEYEHAYVVLGKYSFFSHRPAGVEISNDGADGYVIADAVQFVPVILSAF